MNRNRVGIQLKLGLDFPYDRKWLKSIMGACLALEDVQQPYEINLVVTDNSAIHKLNKKYRHIDRPTDVLSFAYREPDSPAGNVEFITPPEEAGYLGEIVISYPYIMEQARDDNRNIEDELILIIVHGILHLIGYNHESAGDARKMRLRERSITSRITKLLRPR
ncbi:MAG: rRNA maturation RNase YbeY [Dehalococcoidia bacterium]|nr:rRNA maturation RNase YbeY [Dehalococcoidia bacterium]